MNTTLKTCAAVQIDATLQQWRQFDPAFYALLTLDLGKRVLHAYLKWCDYVQAKLNEKQKGE